MVHRVNEGNWRILMMYNQEIILKVLHKQVYQPGGND